MRRIPLARIAHRLRTADPALATATDRQLLDRSRAGADEDAFAELVRRHERTVLAACRQVLSNPSDVDDAFQATFLVLVRQAKRVKCDTSLGGWLFTVAHRVAVRAVRGRARKNRHETAAARPNAVATEPGADLSWREAVVALHEALDALPDRFRLPLILCYLDGLSRDEAAAHLGWSAGSVKGGLERGREKLRAALARRGVTLGAGLLTALAGIGSTASASPELLAAALRVATGSAPAPVLELARSPVTVLTTKVKFLLAPAVAAVLCVGLLAAGRTAPPASEPTAPERRTDTKNESPSQEIKGRVVGPDEKAVAGAKVYAVKMVKPNTTERIEIATSGADGTFRAARPIQEDGFAAFLLVHKDGFGVAWHEFGARDSTNSVELRLVADQAITGRVIDTEGKPVAGAKVFAQRISVPKEGNFDAALAAMKESSFPAHPHVNNAEFRTYRAGALPSVPTDADGKFTLTGCGADRFVELTVSGEGLARGSATVVTRAKFDPAPLNAIAKKWQQENPSRPVFVLDGPDVKLVVELAKVVEGVVVDAVTKKPIAGATVSDLAAPVKTDEAGRFKLGGFRKSKQYSLYVGAPADSAYLPRSVRVDDTEGYSPVKCEIELRRGVAVTGQVTDKSTGKPVRATVSVLPIAGNKYFADYFPGNQFVERAGYLTDADGRFRVVTIPGKLLVTVQSHESVTIGDARLMTYRGSGPDPNHLDVFDTKSQPGYAHLSLADSSLHAVSNLDHGVRVLDVPAEGKPAAVNFALDRGTTGRIRIEGPDGKPVTGCTVIGLAHANVPATLTESTATVYALDPKAAPRRVIVWHAEKKLGATVTIRGNEDDPVAVKLAPLADIRGKFITTDGKPVAGATVLIDPADHLDGLGAFLSVRFGSGYRARVKTAADGTFTLSGVLPGVEYRVRMMKGQTFFPADRETRPPTAKPETGKTFDLGTIDVGKLRGDD
jgi:RNA polymerase sigma factor (sigma-70 family)